MNYSHFYSNTSIPQLFQKIACWTQNCYYDVLGLYLNAVFLVTSHFFPLPHNATWDNTLYHTHKLKTLSKISLEYIWVSIVTGIDIQYISPWCLDPLGRYWDKLEDKRFYATCSIESEPLDVKSLDNDLCLSWLLRWRRVPRGGSCPNEIGKGEDSPVLFQHDAFPWYDRALSYWGFRLRSEVLLEANDE